MAGFSDSRTAAERIQELRGISSSLEKFVSTLPSDDDNVTKLLSLASAMTKQALSIAEYVGG